MAVCDNMSMYVDSAKREHGKGMPLSTAKDLVTALMNKNLNVREDVKAGAIGLAQQIYEFVYAHPDPASLSTEDVLKATCGSYRGYNLPTASVNRHIDSTVQSAWDPMQRVPLCTKFAQSAANVATARDKGMSREEISRIASDVLKNDFFTLRRLPLLTEWVYATPLVPVAEIYAFSYFTCRAENEDRPSPTFEGVHNGLVKCSTLKREEREACTLRLLGQ